MIRTVTKTEVTPNETAKIIYLDCGHVLEIDMEDILSHRFTMKRELNCEECGPAPEPKKRKAGRPKGSTKVLPASQSGLVNKAQGPVVHTPTVLATSPEFAREFNRLINGMSKLDRIRAILEED